jgi:hypothetical protein
MAQVMLPTSFRIEDVHRWQLIAMKQRDCVQLSCCMAVPTWKGAASVRKHHAA